MHIDSLQLELSINLVLIIKTFLCKFEHPTSLVQSLLYLFRFYRILYLIITLDYFLLSNVTHICTHAIRNPLYTNTSMHTYTRHFKCEYMKRPCFSNLMLQVRMTPVISIQQPCNFEKGRKKKIVTYHLILLSRLFYLNYELLLLILEILSFSLDVSNRAIEHTLILSQYICQNEKGEGGKQSEETDRQTDRQADEIGEQKKGTEKEGYVCMYVYGRTCRGFLLPKDRTHDFMEEQGGERRRGWMDGYNKKAEIRVSAEAREEAESSENCPQKKE